MSIEDINSLTMSQFKARIRDIFEIHKMFNSDGKGRITREKPDETRRRIAGKGVIPPARIIK